MCKDIAGKKESASNFVVIGKEYGKKGNWDRAAIFFENAAETGNLDGCFELAECYFYGDGKPRDYVKAAQYYNLATQGTNPEAFLKLAWCYRLRKDGLASEEFSKALLKEAADRGSEEAKRELEQDSRS